MVSGIIAIIIGIGIIIYNNSGSDTQLVIRGTGIDFGYLAIGFGVYYLIRAAIQKNKEKNNVEEDNQEIMETAKASVEDSKSQ